MARTLYAAQCARDAELDASAELLGTPDVAEAPSPLLRLKLSTLMKREQELARDLRSVRKRIRDVQHRRAAFDQHFDVVGER